MKKPGGVIGLESVLLNDQLIQTHGCDGAQKQWSQLQQIRFLQHYNCPQILPSVG